MVINKINFIFKAIFYCLSFTVLCNSDSLQILNSTLGSLSNLNLTLIKPIISTTSYRADFFKKMMGFDERKTLKDWYEKNDPQYDKIFLDNKLIEKIQVNGKDQFIVRSIDGKEYQAGFFTNPTIITLREQLAKLPKTAGGKFNVIIGTDTKLDSPYRRTVDVGALQADPNNIDAVFQVASNFSALEPTGINHYPRTGITIYVQDITQGPFASISAAPGLFYRMYGIFYDPAKKSIDWRQTKDHQVELLGGGLKYPHLKKVFPVTNGYVNYRDYPEALAIPLTKKDYEEIRVGYHRDIQVLYGFTTHNSQYDVFDKNQIINQVFTAAIDFGNLNADYKDNPVVIERAKALLDAAYEGTLLAAATNKKNKVFLTLIGGGVFENDIDWIADSIKKQEELIKNSGLDVTLIIYSYSSLKSHSQSLTHFKSMISGLLTETKGSVMIDGEIKNVKDFKKL